MSTVYIAASRAKKVLDGLGNWNNVYNKLWLHLIQSCIFVYNERIYVATYHGK
jgi:hypothetical protein